eukprot:COSAG01_NODE_16551_length_1227_cov_0.758865_1_plen_54_part_01
MESLRAALIDILADVHVAAEVDLFAIRRFDERVLPACSSEPMSLLGPHPHPPLL